VLLNKGLRVTSNMYQGGSKNIGGFPNSGPVPNVMDPPSNGHTPTAGRYENWGKFQTPLFYPVNRDPAAVKEKAPRVHNLGG